MFISGAVRVTRALYKNRVLAKTYHSLLMIVLLFLASGPIQAAVQFSATTPTQAGTFTLQWSGARGFIKLGESTPANTGGLLSSSSPATGSLTLTRTQPGLYQYYLYNCFYSPPNGTPGCEPNPIVIAVTVGFVPAPTVSASFSPITISENGNATLTWSATNATSCSATGISGVNAVSGTVVYTAPTVMSANQSINIPVTCTGDGGSATATATLTINWVNDVPTISSIPARTINEDANTGAISFVVGDEETTATSLSVTATSSNTAVIPNGNIHFDGSGANRIVVVVPATNTSGNSTITVNVSDGTSTASTSFVVTVNAVNDAPTISDITNISINESTGSGAIGFSVGDIDTAANSLTVSASSSNTNLIPNGNISVGGSGNSRTITVVPASNKTGTSTITVTVSDGALTASDTFVVTVADLPATFTSIPSVSSNGVVPFSWSNAREFVTIKVKSDTGNWITIIEQGAVSGSFTDTRTQTGTYLYLILDCYFAGGPPNGNPTCSGGETRTVVVTLPGPTVSASISPTTISEGGSATLTWSSTNTTSCSATNISGVSATSGTATYTAPAVMSANQSITIPVTCIGGGGSATTNAPLTINWINDVPTISPISARTINEDSSTGVINFTVVDEETAPGSLTVTASSSNTAVIPASNISFGGSGVNRTVVVTPATNASGNSTITVTVSDGSLTASTSFVVTINGINDGPIISDIANLSSNEDASSSTIGFTVGDIDTAARSLVVSASSSNTGLIPNTNINLGGSGAARTIAVTPVANAIGTSTITVTVSDGALTATDTFIVTVNAVNDAPTITSPGNATINEDASTGARNFTINDLDTAATSLVVTATSSNTALIPNNNLVLAGTTGARSINVTPVANASGAATITLVVSDGQLTASQSFTVTVNVVNDAPTISDIANLSVNESTGSGAIGFTVGDIDTAANSLTVSASSSNTGLIPNGNISLGGSGNSRTISIVPAANKTGSATITVTVSDGALTASDIFTVTVNDLPATFTSILSSSSNGVVPFSWSNAREYVDIRVKEVSGSWISLVSQGATAGSFTDTRSQTGTYIYQILDCYFSGGPPNGNPVCTVTDIREVVITLPAPTANASIAPSTINEGNTATLTWSSTNATSCSATGISGVSAISGTVTYTAPAVMSANQSITIPVTCIGGGGSVTKNVPLTINWVNDTPTISPISARAINEDTNTGVINFTVVDEETAPGSLTVTASSSNTAVIPTNNISFGGSGVNRTVVVTPAANATGNSTITLTVSDGSLTASTSFAVTVNGVNDAPTIANIANLSINEDASSNAIGFTVGDIDTAATSLVISASSSNTGLIPNANINVGGSGAARTIAVTPVANTTGISTITVTVSDGALTATDTFIVTVNAVNDAPTISSPGNATINEDASTGARNFTINDLDTAATSLVVTATSSNTALIPNSNLVLAGTTGTRSINVTPIANASGSATITLVVSDGQLTASQSFTVTVNGVNDAPTIADIANLSINESTGSGAIGFTVDDIDTAANLLTVTASSSNISLIPNGNISLGGSGNSRTISVVPAANKTGSATITVTVSDGALTTSDTFTVTVNDLPATFTNIPTTSSNGAVSFTWDYAREYVTIKVKPIAGDWTTLVEQGAVSGSFTDTRTLNGTYVYLLQDCYFAGGPPNGNPTCNTGEGRTVVVTFPTPVITASFTPSAIAESSASGAANTASLSWSATNAQNCSATGTSGVNGISGSVTYTAPSVMATNQTVNVVITCTGQGPSSVAKPVSLTVNAVNDLPTISAINTQNIQEDQVGGTGALTFIVNDEETLPTSLTVTAVSSNQAVIRSANLVLSGSGANRSIQVTPLLNMSGSSTITLTVSDGQATSTSTFVVNVASVNDQPTLIVPDDQRIDKDTATSVLGIRVGDVETAATSLTVTAASDRTDVVAASGIVIGDSGANRTIKITPVTGKAGLVTITVNVSDGQLVTNKTFKVSVQETSANNPFDFSSDVPSEFNYPLTNSAIPGLGTNQLVATTQGKLNVSSGAASYSIPIELPPAVRDLKPGLSLNYNSRSGNGLMGVGWNLGGLSAITRCHANFATEGAEAQKPNPRYTTGDRLCLDGQKLVVASSTTAANDATYWATNTEYKTELDNFAKIVAYSSSENGGHGYFKVWTKDGRTLTYGAEDNSQASKIYAPNQDAGPINTWALDKVEDAYGNSYTITYERNTVNGEYYPQQINLGSTGLVVFSYQSRNGQTPWGYDVGNKYQFTKVLDKVTTYLGTTQATPIKQYDIDYKTSATTNRELVDKIVECGYESSAWKCARPLTFDWQEGELGFESTPHPVLYTNNQPVTDVASWDDMNGDGYVDAVGQKRILAWGTANGNFIATNSAESGFFHVIQTRQGKATLKMDSHTALGVYANQVTSAGVTTSELIASTTVPAIANPVMRTVDLNNDGLTDLTINSQFWIQQTNASFVGAPVSAGSSYLNSGAELSYVDVNSDGLLDQTIVAFHGYEGQMVINGEYRNLYNNVLYVNPNTGDSFGGVLGSLGRVGSAPKTIMMQGGGHAPDYLLRKGNLGVWRTWIDINGDGNMDTLYDDFHTSDLNIAKKWAIKLSTGGQQYSVPPLAGTGVTVVPMNNIAVGQYSFAMDYNKDGIDDLVVFTGDPAGVRNLRVFYGSYVNGTLAFVNSGVDPFGGKFDYLLAEVTLSPSAMVNPFRGDANNDGILDLYILDKVYLAKQQQPDLINKITDGFGATTELAYSPLTGDANNGKPLYTPDTVASVFPQQPVNRAAQVVKKISTSNGQSGFNHTYFNYTGGVQDIFRGSSGFKSIAITNTATNVNSTTEYRQDWPYTGSIKKQTVKDSSGKLISITENSYALHSQNARFPYLHYSLQKSYELSTTSESSPLSVSKSINTFDTCGNITEQNSKVGNGFSGIDVTGELSNQRTVNVYEYYGTPACNDDFLTSSTQEVAKTGNADLKSVITEFTPNVQRDVKTRTDFKDESIQVSTTYERETNGVVNKITEAANDIDGTNEPARVTTLSNFAYGMYPQTITNAENHTATSTYDYRFGSVATQTFLGLTTTNTYDALGRVQQQQAADGTSTENIAFYCSSAPVTCPTGAYYGVASRVTNSNPSQDGKLGEPLSITFYDALQREIRSVVYSLDGKVINQASEYAANGYVTRVSEPYATSGIVADTAFATAWTNYSSYDALGRANSIVGADGGSKTTAYSTDGYGFKTSENILVVKPGGSSETQTTNSWINSLGQVTRVEDALLNTVSYAYDSAGNLETTQVNNNIVTKIDILHDLAGNKTYIKDPDAGVINFDYNGFGELRKQTWQKNVAGVEKYITYDYDKLGRQISRTDKPASGSNVSYSWVWDTKQQGQLSSRSGNGFSEEYFYDGFSRLSRQIVTTNGLSGGEFTYTYDNFSRASTVQYPNGFKIERNYHADGYQIQTRDVTVAATPKVLWVLGNTIDARGAFNNQLWGNGVVTQTGFDSTSGRLSNIKSGRLSSANNIGNLYGDIQNLSYTFDSLGNLYSRTTARTDNNGLALENTTESFGYDKLNRLATSTTSGLFGRTQTYQYDTGGLGNLVNRSDILTGSSTNNDVGALAYDQVRNAGIHAVTSAGGINYSYDKYGNMIARGSESIIYDTFNKPTRIAGSSITDFYYGPDHELYKEVSGTKTTYKLAGGVYEVIVDGTTTTQKSYVDGVIINNRVLTNGIQSANDTQYLHTDHLGSVEATTNALGQFVNRMSFGAWGERQKSDWKPGAPTESFLTTNGYTGHDQLNNHNLVHMGGRVYDPNLGRFLSADLFIQSPYNTQSFNRYSYTFNNPLSYTDPSGYSSEIFNYLMSQTFSHSSSWMWGNDFVQSQAQINNLQQVKHVLSDVQLTVC